MRLMTLVRDMEGLTPSEKVVLYTMAAYASEDGTGIYPGLELLEKKTGLSHRSLVTMVNRLVKGGKLKEEGRKGMMKEYSIPVKDLWPESYQLLGKKKPAAPATTPYFEVPGVQPPTNGHKQTEELPPPDADEEQLLPPDDYAPPIIEAEIAQWQRLVEAGRRAEHLAGHSWADAIIERGREAAARLAERQN